MCEGVVCNARARTRPKGGASLFFTTLTLVRDPMSSPSVLSFCPRRISRRTFGGGCRCRGE